MNLGRRGLDVRTAGRSEFYILSDDNFNPQQRTLLLMFEDDRPCLNRPPWQPAPSRSAS